MPSRGNSRSITRRSSSGRLAGGSTPEWATTASRAPSRTLSNRVAAPPAPPAAALPSTPPARESSARRAFAAAAAPGLVRSVSFCDDAAGASLEAPTSPRGGRAHAEEMRARAEGLRIQAALLEREAHAHEQRQRVASGNACSGSSAAFHDAWGEMMKFCAAAVELAVAATSCAEPPPPAPRRVARPSTLGPRGLPPVRSDTRTLPLADPGPAPLPPSRTPSGVVPPPLQYQRSVATDTRERRSSSGGAPSPTGSLLRVASTPAERGGVSGGDFAPPGASPASGGASGLLRRALRNLNGARRREDAAAAAKAAPQPGSPRSGSLMRAMK